MGQESESRDRENGVKKSKVREWGEREPEWRERGSGVREWGKSGRESWVRDWVERVGQESGV